MTNGSGFIILTELVAEVEGLAVLVAVTTIRPLSVAGATKSPLAEIDPALAYHFTPELLVP